MDPFEEFEFKPLTEGIGFHKKTSSLKESSQKAALVEEELNRAVPEPPPNSLLGGTSAKTRSKANIYGEMMKATEKSGAKSTARGLGNMSVKELTAQALEAFPLEITETLPRPSSEPTAPRAPLYPPAPNMPETDRAPLQSSLSDKTFLEEAADPGVRRGAADSPVRNLEKAPICLRAALLDFMFVLALSLVFLVSLLMVTGVSLSLVVSNIKVDPTTQLSMALLFVAVMQMYVVVARSFFGKTLGEWTFDHQMGSIEQQRGAFYPLLVAWRSLVITLTGIVLLPLLSFVIRRDIAAYLTGLQLYRQRNG